MRGLARQGWSVIRVWECDVKGNIDAVASEGLASVGSKEGSEIREALAMLRSL
jgi:G:T-mismatch repair DNA endonuclease (very short patch repair protein)